MFSENSINLQTDCNEKRNHYIKNTMEKEVIRALQKEEYTLNRVNSYGENLLHISAANGCLDIAKEILRKHDCSQVIDRKNKFGWTPLMLAIRNKHIKMVKYLLQKNANINESTYLGMSVFGLAAAINKTMFETVYEACPAALLNSLNDDITPLCIAAMKNDKNLFFKLIELGFDVSKNNETKDKQLDKNEVVFPYAKNNENVNELPLQRLQSIRPPDLNIQHKEDLDTTLEYVPEFSPLRPSNVPPNINDENVFGENTPTPPRYRTPPRGMILNPEEAKMFVLLKHHGLGQHLPIFLKQEVDIDLFMTLTNEDLIEIGIENEVDRKAILDVIICYKKSDI